MPAKRGRPRKNPLPPPPLPGAPVVKRPRGRPKKSLIPPNQTVTGLAAPQARNLGRISPAKMRAPAQAADERTKEAVRMALAATDRAPKLSPVHRTQSEPWPKVAAPIMIQNRTQSQGCQGPSTILAGPSNQATNQTLNDATAQASTSQELSQQPLNQGTMEATAPPSKKAYQAFVKCKYCRNFHNYADYMYSNHICTVGENIDGHSHSFSWLF